MADPQLPPLEEPPFAYSSFPRHSPANSPTSAANVWRSPDSYPSVEEWARLNLRERESILGALPRTEHLPAIQSPRRLDDRLDHPYYEILSRRALRSEDMPSQALAAVSSSPSINQNVRAATTPQIDLRTLEYPSGYDDQLMCAICRCPFVHPIRLRCDHIFCQQCFIEAQQILAVNGEKCPSCRSPITPLRGVQATVPRIITNMIEELRVKCPYSNEGCEDITTRGSVQTHVEKYCQYAQVDCPSSTCALKTRRRQIVPNICLHEELRCSECDEMIIQQDVETHVKSCPKSVTECPGCKASIQASTFKQHLEICPDLLLPCAAAKFGCKTVSSRAMADEHTSSCTLLLLAPYLQSREDKIQDLEATVKHLKLRNDVLEGGLSGIRSAVQQLGTAANETPISDFHSTTLPLRTANHANRNSTPIFEPTGLTAPPPEYLEATQTPIDIPTTPAPFDSPTHHLLSLHESLRDEVSRISAALNDLDARSSMTIMNETLRLKEELTHTNAAVGSMRLSLNWLIGARLAQQRMMGTAGNVNTTSPIAGPSNAGPSAMGRRSRSSDSSTGVGGLGSERTKL